MSVRFLCVVADICCMHVADGALIISAVFAWCCLGREQVFPLLVEAWWCPVSGKVGTAC